MSWTGCYHRCACRGDIVVGASGEGGGGGGG